MKITIIYDNYDYVSGLETGWGFSCLIQGFEKTLLFDTGGDARVLLSNMKKLGIEPRIIDKIFLSHDHWDHTGGLFEFLKRNADIDVYITGAFSRELKREVIELGADLVENDRSGMILPDVYTTGEMGKDIKEQSLVFKMEKGLVVVTGCAHPGIVKILETVQHKFNEKFFLVFGGFHLGGLNRDSVKNIVTDFRKLGVKKVGPCHCSGEQTREIFKEVYKKEFIGIGVGAVIED